MAVARDAGSNNGWTMKYDTKNRERLNQLGPNTKKAAYKWYSYLTANKVEILITETMRTSEQQAIYVKQGASQTMRSYHLVGQAIDFVPVVNGQANYNAYDNDNIKKAVAKAKELGFEWGGDWKSFVDKPHLQYEHKGYGTDKPGSGSSGEFRMPTVDDYNGADSYGYQSGLRSRIAGTDQWNDLILKVCQAQGVNPVFLKLIMATESSGNKNIGTSPSGAIGLMQIMPSWGFDNSRLASDPEYAITKACDVFKAKSKMNKNLSAAQNNGGPDSIFNIAHAYIGWGKDPNGTSKSGTYHAQISGMYEGFGLKKTDSVFTTPSGDFSGGNGENYTAEEYQAIYEGRKIVGPGGFYDGEVFEGISGIYDKPTFLPPHYYDDDFSQLRHRYTQGDYFMRIGDSRFVIPPTQIRVSEQSNIKKFQSIRQKQSMKVTTGSKMKTIEMSLMFTDWEQVNGHMMDGPDGQVYFMDGLRSLLAQMKTMPFLPVENEFLNFVHNIYAVAILSVNVGVVEGFPGMMKADLTLIEFDPEPYLNKPAWLYDSHFIWPIFRWHYQRLLNGETKTGEVLAPFVGDDVLRFWHLDEDALNNHDEEVKAEVEKRAVAKGDADKPWEVEDGSRVKTWWDFNDKLASTKGTNALFKEHPIPANYSIVDINATFGNNLTPLTPSLTGKPTFQYFGSQDARFNILIQTQDRQVIKAFNDLKDTVDRYAREYRDGFVSSMLRLENNFINMLGVKGVLIESLSTSTVDGSPNDFYVAMTLVSFDETQHEDEKLGHLDSIDFEKVIQGEENLAGLMSGGTLETFDNNVTQMVAAETAMNDLELYPDLELPTYDEFNKAVGKIEEWRKKQGFGAIGMGELVGPTGAKYVDPDFYFSYPSAQVIVDSLKEALSNPDIGNLALDSTVDLAKEYGESVSEANIKDFFGAKSVAQIDQHQDAEKLKDTYNEMGFGDLEGLDTRWALKREFFTNPSTYTRRFWIKAWMGEGGEWATKSTDIEDAYDNDWKVAYYSKQTVQASVQMLTQEDFFIGMMHDMMKYDRRGTMMRAFPTYVFVIIDEGRYVNVRKLWDNYYTYHSISEINVHMDRVSPIHTAYITLSNVYGALNNKGVYHQKVNDPTWGGMVDSFLDSFVSNVTEKELLERTIIYKSIQLMAGARIHIRMGYGSCASSLPPVFNGIITEINAGDMVNVVAQSFGYELTNEIGAEPGSNNSMFEEGLESTELFRYYMTERQSNYTWAWRNSAEPENYQSAYGIEHFGFLRVRDEQNLTDIFNGWYWDHEKEINAEDYDIMKNVYSTLGYTKIGTDETADTDSEPSSNLSGLDKNKDLKELRKDVTVIWPQNEIPTVLKWKDKKPDIKKLKIVDEFLINEPLTKLEDKGDAKELIEELAENKDLSTEQCRKIMEALYWWMASPTTTSRIAGTDGKWGDGKKKDRYKKDVEDFWKPMKELHPKLYKEAVAESMKIVNEWQLMSNALNAYLVADNKGFTETLIDSVTPGSDDDETNVRMQLEGKAPWDVFRTLERVTPEYVVYPHIHQFGYTLFFGKPWWDVQCAYVLPPVKKKPDKYGKKISDYVELTKPFSQVHFYTSYGDIIGNNIKAVGTDLATAVIPVFQLGKKDEAYEIVWADYYIRGSFQRTKTIDTSLVQNIPYMPNWMEKLGTGVLNFFDGATKYQKHAVRFAQGVIAETFRNMYQGELIVIGDPSVKPYDVMYIDDFYSKMNGTADVGKVTHMLSVDTGFITSITPDLSVIMNPDPTANSEEWASDPSVASGNFFRYSHLVTEFSLHAWRVYSLYKISQFLTSTKNLGALVNVSKFLKIHGAVQKVVGVATIGAAKVGSKLPTVAKGYKTVRNVVSAFRLNALRTAAAGAAVPGPGWAATAVSLASVFASTMLITALDKMFVQKYNNVIKIFPLFYQGRPYVAGINGHKQLIPGWEDNGNGKPVRVEYGNYKKFSPKKASEVHKLVIDLDDQIKNESAERNDKNAVTDPNAQVSADPAKWLGTLSSSVRKNRMFAAPIYLGKEGKGYAGMKARITPGSGYKTSKRPDHWGIDFFRGGPNKNNDGIVAFADGEVMYAGRFNPDGFGTIILIKHAFEKTDGSKFVFWTLYAHMHDNEIRIEQGDMVKAGQLLAYMGAAGGSDGEHLHFEVHLAVDSKKSDKVKRGKDTLDHVFASGRPHTNRTNPQTFIEGIIAYDSNLVKYVEYKV